MYENDRYSEGFDHAFFSSQTLIFVNDHPFLQTQHSALQQPNHTLHQVSVPSTLHLLRRWRRRYNIFLYLPAAWTCVPRLCDGCAENALFSLCVVCVDRDGLLWLRNPVVDWLIKILSCCRLPLACLSPPLFYMEHSLSNLYRLLEIWLKTLTT